MTETYTPPSISNFNDNPPDDDGSISAANMVEWAKHIDEIGTPLKNYADAINSAVGTAIDNILDNNVAISVTDPVYGADDTGVSDSTTAINNAITAATASGRAVYIPAGTYLISDTITVPNGLRLYGDGIAKSTLQATAAVQMMDIPENAYYWSISDIQLDGDDTATSGLISGVGGSTSNNGIGELKIQVRNIAGHAIDLRGTIFTKIFAYTYSNAGKGIRMTLDSNINDIYLWSIEDEEGLYLDSSSGNYIKANLEKNSAGILHVTNGSQHNRIMGWFENVGAPTTYNTKIDGLDTNHNTLYNIRVTATPGASRDHIVVGDVSNNVVGNVFRDIDLITVSSPTYAHINLLNADYTIIENCKDTSTDGNEIFLKESSASSNNRFCRAHNYTSIVGYSANTDLDINDENQTASITTGASTITVNLGDAATCRGRKHIIVKADAGAGEVAFTADGGSLLPSSNLTTQYQARTYQSNGTNWIQVGA